MWINKCCFSRLKNIFSIFSLSLEALDVYCWSGAPWYVWNTEILKHLFFAFGKSYKSTCCILRVGSCAFGNSSEDVFGAVRSLHNFLWASLWQSTYRASGLIKILTSLLVFALFAVSWFLSPNWKAKIIIKKSQICNFVFFPSKLPKLLSFCL